MGASTDAAPAAADAQPGAAVPAAASQSPAADGAYSGLLDALRRSPKQLPCSYLYDAAGSELYERITELDEYYPFRTEQAMLRQHAREIVCYIAPGSVVVELGCGSAQKTSILLNELLARDGPEQVRFAGIDCSSAALDMAKAALLGSCEGLAPRNISLVCQEYTQGVAECRRLFPNQQLVVLWLGSSVGNLNPAEAVQFFRDMTAGAGSNIQVLLCADMWKQRDVLHAAYCDREGVTEAFIKNGVRHAFGSLSCAAAADPNNWDYEVDVNAEDTQVEMWLRAKADIGRVADGVSIADGERVLVEVSRKFTPGKLAGLAYNSGLYIQVAWRTDMYSMQLLVSPEEALRRCWADADAFFSKVPDWNAHPIAVRHPFCFYYGHIAAFAKIKMLPDMPVRRMDDMMSRGIDPDVADPSHCHSHPDVPDKWPSRQELRAYVAQTRGAILQHSGLDSCCRHADTMRRVCLALEHDRMHLETLMYMAVQQVKADFLAGPERPATPRGSQSAKLSASGGKAAACNTVSVAEGTVQLGAPTDGSAGFVWDNEGPLQPPQQVAPFRVAASPVTIGEFYSFADTARGYKAPEFWAPEDHALFAGRGQVLPATWSQAYEGASVFVHWPNGSTCGWRDVMDEPVLCSLAEAQAYCRFRGAGARVMSEPEYERLLSPDVHGRVRQLRSSGWEWTSTPFEPLPGFTPMPDYPEYSTDFFDGKHFVLRGASAVTDPAMRRDSFRNFYQKQYPYVFAKFRMCYDGAADSSS